MEPSQRTNGVVFFLPGVSTCRYKRGCVCAGLKQLLLHRRSLVEQAGKLHMPGSMSDTRQALTASGKSNVCVLLPAVAPFIQSFLNQDEKKFFHEYCL